MYNPLTWTTGLFRQVYSELLLSHPEQLQAHSAMNSYGAELEMLSILNQHFVITDKIES